MYWSVQLYTARHTALPEAFDLVARHGFTRVEGYADIYDSPRQLKGWLEKHGLSMPSGHFSRAQLSDNIQNVFATAGILGMDTIICPMLPAAERPATAGGWRGFAEELEGYRQACESQGFRFAWHNHDYEFKPLPDGSIPMTHLLAAAPLLDWQIDAAWMVRAGQDPLFWIERYAERIRSVHMKDLAGPGQGAEEDGWADPGHGIMDWKRLREALETSQAISYVMEHDLPKELDRFLQRAEVFARGFH